MNSSSALIDLQSALITMSLVVPRVFVCLSILPGFGTRTLTGIAKNGIAFAIALPAAVPTYFFVQQAKLDYFLAGMLITKEVVIGLMLGILLSIPAWVAQSIGSILDAQRSPIQVQNNNPSLDQDASPLGGMLLQAVMLVMIQTGLFVAMVRILIESYAAWPASTLIPPFEQGHFDVLLQRFGHFFWHIIVYGGPVLIPLLLIDLSFAVLGAFAPSLQVSFASSPIKSLVGLFILLVYWPTFSHYVVGDFSGILDLAASLIDAGGRR